MACTRIFDMITKKVAMVQNQECRMQNDCLWKYFEDTSSSQEHDQEHWEGGVIQLQQEVAGPLLGVSAHSGVTEPNPVKMLPTPGEAKAKAMPGRLYIHTKITTTST